jgi:hypothetical protein
MFHELGLASQPVEGYEIRLDERPYNQSLCSNLRLGIFALAYITAT